MWYQYIKIVVTQACCQNSGITHPTLQMIKTLPKLRFFNDKKKRFLDGVRYGVLRRKKASEVRRAG